MYIQKLEVNNFRQLKNITINFEKIQVYLLVRIIVEKRL